jgi:hypothetical protein
VYMKKRGLIWSKSYLSLCIFYMVKFTSHENIILENIYFNLSKAGAYVGLDKLYRVLKSKDITHIGKHKVRKWLQSQDDYSLRREQRHSFRKVRVVVSDLRISLIWIYQMYLTYPR